MEILYQDSDIAVVEKPVGLDAEQGMPCALQAQIGGSFYTVHRLDQNVGGVMVYARNQKTAAELSRQIQNGSFVKEYVALVHGTPEEAGDWTDFLFKDSRKNKVFVVKKERTGVKKARLTYRCLRAGEQSLVHIRLYTGRSHQIRVQFASRKMPICGDGKYGSREKCDSLALWSHSLSFDYKGKQLSFSKEPDTAKPFWNLF